MGICIFLHLNYIYIFYLSREEAGEEVTMEEVMEDTTIVHAHVHSLGHVVVPGQDLIPDQELAPLDPDQDLALSRGPVDHVPGRQGRALDLLLQRNTKTEKITIARTTTVKITSGLLYCHILLHFHIEIC